MTVIETEKLSKKFNDFFAVEDISLHVSQCEIYGFLGLNGAGKTTTIRLLLGMIKADAGTLFWVFCLRPSVLAAS
jgi:ABC-2 type transport system ATP-binding protein